MRKGTKRAAVAVGHRILVMAYSVLADHGLYHHGPYQGLGADDDDRRTQQIIQRRLVHRPELLGFDLPPPHAPAACPRYTVTAATTGTPDRVARSARMERKFAALRSGKATGLPTMRQDTDD